jgi:hypothetical protein
MYIMAKGFKRMKTSNGQRNDHTVDNIILGKWVFTPPAI